MKLLTLFLCSFVSMNIAFGEVLSKGDLTRLESVDIDVLQKTEIIDMVKDELFDMDVFLYVMDNYPRDSFAYGTKTAENIARSAKRDELYDYKGHIDLLKAGIRRNIAAVILRESQKGNIHIGDYIALRDAGLEDYVARPVAYDAAKKLLDITVFLDLVEDGYNPLLEARRMALAN